MDERTLRVLEYPKIKARLADLAACSLGKRRALGLEPDNCPDRIARALAETTEAVQAVERHGRVPFGGLTDVSDLVRRARVGGTLEGAETNAVRDALRASRLVRAHFGAHADDLPCLAGRATGLHDYQEVEDAVSDALDDDGQVVDDASPELSRLRRRARQLHDDILTRLEELARRPALSRMLRERLPTVRNGRFCLPVKSQFQSQFDGIIHDRSDSAQTVFMEPQAIVPLGNDLRDAELAAEEEVRRILKDLSSAIGAHAAAILDDLAALGELDVIVAKAHLSIGLKGAAADLDDTGYLALLKARHPLLPAEEVVSIDVSLGRESRALLITGPNTGGKTVTLKTIGLLALMNQSGLHIPADAGSRLPVFSHILADIGDEQSIEQSLSTFSSHMGQIVHILRSLAQEPKTAARDGQRALVLLDEIGAGTDPTEGAALAKAILATLVERDARVVATTHHNELKVFAHNHPDVENASVEFDPVTLQPTFHLRIGVPGSSNAFDIAERLGLSLDIVRRARDSVQQGAAAVEDMIRDLERSRRELASERSAAGAVRADLDELARRHEEQIARLSAERDRLLREAHERAAGIVREVEEEARRIIADLQAQPRQSKVTEERLAELRAVRRRIEAVAEPGPSHPPPEVRPGDLVCSRRLGRQGLVVAHPVDGTVAVQMGKMRVEAPLTDLELVEAYEDEASRDDAARLRLVKAFETSGEIHLRGLTVDEGLVELEKYLDDAFLAGRDSVRIVHGKGTGVLRQAIHEYLSTHPHVRSFADADRASGGEGVTIVRL